MRTDKMGMGDDETEQDKQMMKNNKYTKTNKNKTITLN